MHTHSRIDTCTRTHAYIHILMHTYTHTCMNNILLCIYNTYLHTQLHTYIIYRLCIDIHACIHACINRDVYYTYKNAPEHACLCGYINVCIVLSFSNEISSGKNVWSTGGSARTSRYTAPHPAGTDARESAKETHTHDMISEEHLQHSWGADDELLMPVRESKHFSISFVHLCMPVAGKHHYCHYYCCHYWVFFTKVNRTPSGTWLLLAVDVIFLYIRTLLVSLMVCESTPERNRLRALHR